MLPVMEMIEKYNIPIVNVDINRSYWLVRTNGGEYFQDFFLGDFIGINWNEFNNPEDFNDQNKDKTTREIVKNYPDNKQPGHTFSQIKRFFHEIKIGDIVMIPSKDSKHIAFGEVISDVYIVKKSQTEIDEGECPYSKRRNVKWLKTVDRKKLDPFLYRMMNTHLTISNANDYADSIDRTLYSYYFKGDKAHLVLNVKQEKDIPLVDLLDALQAPLDLVGYIKDPINNTTFQKKDLDAKLRLQSPGIIEFVSSGEIFGLSILLGVALVGLAGGKLKFNANKEKIEGEMSTDGLLEKIFKFKKHADDKEANEQTKKELALIKEKLNNASKNLEIETPKELENFFTDSPRERSDKN